MRTCELILALFEGVGGLFLLIGVIGNDRWGTVCIKTAGSSALLVSLLGMAKLFGHYNLHAQTLLNIPRNVLMGVTMGLLFAFLIGGQVKRKEK